MSTVEGTARVADTFCDLILDRQPIRHRRRISDINRSRKKIMRDPLKRRNGQPPLFVQEYRTATRSMAGLLNAIIYICEVKIII